jgi:hypothetical protein
MEKKTSRAVDEGALIPRVRLAESLDNSLETGQVMFADGGADAILRGERTELGDVRYGFGQRMWLLVEYPAAQLRHRRAPGNSPARLASNPIGPDEGGE